MLENKKVFIFDMDGLLIDTERLHIQMWAEVFQAHGEEIDYDLLNHTIGTSGKQAQNICLELKGDANYLSRYREEKIERTKDYIRHHELHTLKGVKELLEYLKSHDIERILVSSTYDDEVDLCLRQAHIHQYFDKRVCGNHVKLSKPDPEIYLLALKKYNLNKEECIVFEDSINGIKASSQAGIDVIGIPDLIPLDNVKEKHLLTIFDSLEDVLHLLQ